MRDVMDAVRNDAARSQVKRKSNRERMPNVAEIVDQIEEFFGKPKVLWCKEGDIELGKRDEWDATPRKDQERGKRRGMQ